MLKQTIQYTDFDDKNVTEVLYFNLTKVELTDNLDMQTELESLQETLSGPQRELTVPEIKLVLEAVKKLARLSYGVRSEDGKRFSKSYQIWKEFTETAAYDTWLWGLFENPQKAVEWMLGVLPQDLRARVEVEQRQILEQTGHRVVETVRAEGLNEPITEAQVVAASRADLDSMSLDELQAAMNRRANQA